MTRDEIPIVILCGGRGTRLGRDTAMKQKCMLEFDGLPMLYYVIDKFYKLGYRRFYLSVGYKAYQVLEVDWAVVFPYASFDYHYWDKGKEEAVGWIMEQFDLSYAWIINGDTYITDWLPSTVFETDCLLLEKHNTYLVTRQPPVESLKDDLHCGAELRFNLGSPLSRPCIIDGTYYDIGTPERFERFAAYVRSMGVIPNEA